SPCEPPIPPHLPDGQPEFIFTCNRAGTGARALDESHRNKSPFPERFFLREPSRERHKRTVEHFLFLIAAQHVTGGGQSLGKQSDQVFVNRQGQPWVLGPHPSESLG